MENLMSMFSPEMMKGLMENEELQKMMNDPKVMDNLQNMMGNRDLFGGLDNTGDANDANDEACQDGSTCDINGNCEDGSKCCEGECEGDDPEELELDIEDLDSMELEESEIRVGDKVRTKGLSNLEFNDKVGVVDDYIAHSKRFVILFEDKKIAAIKEENLENFYQNIENID